MKEAFAAVDWGEHTPDKQTYGQLSADLKRAIFESVRAVASTCKPPVKLPSVHSKLKARVAEYYDTRRYTLRNQSCQERGAKRKLGVAASNDTRKRRKAAVKEAVARDPKLSEQECKRIYRNVPCTAVGSVQPTDYRCVLGSGVDQSPQHPLTPSPPCLCSTEEAKQQLLAFRQKTLEKARGQRIQNLLDDTEPA